MLCEGDPYGPTLSLGPTLVLPFWSYLPGPTFPTFPTLVLPFLPSWSYLGPTLVLPSLVLPWSYLEPCCVRVQMASTAACSGRPSLQAR